MASEDHLWNSPVVFFFLDGVSVVMEQWCMALY